MFEGERIVADVAGDPSMGDIDIHFYRELPPPMFGVEDLTPCPPCDVLNGQSGGSTEHFEWIIKSAAMGEGDGRYFLVVKAYFTGESNEYDLSATIDQP